MFGFINGKPDNGVRKDILRHPSLPSDILVLERVLGTHDKEGANLLNVVKSSEVVVCSVKHIEGSRFIWDGIHPVDIMELRLRYVEDGWHLGFKVEQSMNFDPSFRPPEMSPFVNAETKVNCR